MAEIKKRTKLCSQNYADNRVIIFLQLKVSSFQTLVRKPSSVWRAGGHYGIRWRELIVVFAVFFPRYFKSDSQQCTLY